MFIRVVHACHTPAAIMCARSAPSSSPYIPGPIWCVSSVVTQTALWGSDKGLRAQRPPPPPPRAPPQRPRPLRVCSDRGPRGRGHGQADLRQRHQTSEAEVARPPRRGARGTGARRHTAPGPPSPRRPPPPRPRIHTPASRCTPHGRGPVGGSGNTGSEAEGCSVREVASARGGGGGGAWLFCGGLFFFSRPFCERPLGPPAALDTLCLRSCDLQVRRVALTSSPTTPHPT